MNVIQSAWRLEIVINPNLKIGKNIRYYTQTICLWTTHRQEYAEFKANWKMTNTRSQSVASRRSPESLELDGTTRCT